MSNRYPVPLIQRRADPWIYRHSDGLYYYTATVPAYDRIELRRADTIAGLADAEPHTLWQKHGSGPMSALIWAPELHFLRGRWYLYFAAAHTDAPHPVHGTFQHRMYVLEADQPLGPWRERGQIDSGMDSFCLDATVFAAGGRLYYVWAQKDPEITGNSNIYIAEMETPWKLKTGPVLLTRPEYDWECSVIPVNEGPAALLHGGRVFLTYSANATGAEYCVGLLTAPLDAPLLEAGSWQKSAAPVFGSCPQNGKFGPGHNGFTLAEDGETPLIVYHVRDTDNISGDPLRDPGRHTCVQPFRFDARGYPVFGVPEKNTNK